MQDREFVANRHALDGTLVEKMEKEGRVLANVVEVRTDRTRRIALYQHNDMALDSGDLVVVETERGTTAGVVMSRPERRYMAPGTLRAVVRRQRKAEAAEQQSPECGEREEQARSVCARFVGTLGLDMKVVGAEYLAWENRVILYFVAEGRIDFRELVKELSRMLRCRIEMRQIGPRDETKMLGGVSRCGREFCCSSYLREFGSVRTKMAKEQGLVVNQEKITGHCRKLLCCLAYERDAYAHLRANLPGLGSIVETPSGPGKVVELQILRQAVRVHLQSDMTYKVFPLGDVRFEGKDAAVEPDGDEGDEPDGEEGRVRAEPEGARGGEGPHRGDRGSDRPRREERGERPRRDDRTDRQGAPRGDRPRRDDPGAPRGDRPRRDDPGAPRGDRPRRDDRYRDRGPRDDRRGDEGHSQAPGPSDATHAMNPAALAPAASGAPPQAELDAPFAAGPVGPDGDGQPRRRRRRRRRGGRHAGGDLAGGGPGGGDNSGGPGGDDGRGPSGGDGGDGPGGDDGSDSDE
jgi:cell fate regulator YaaT (PSP1 superfamily)